MLRLACVRIIAGSRKGHTIFAPKGHTTRPTGDRVREAAFNLIGPVDGATVLDLFAGSGAMGLEAARSIERNLDKLRLTGAVVVRLDARTALAAEAAARRIYDLVLADPPYDDWPELETRIAPYLAEVLAPDGLLVVETAARVEPDLPLPQRTSRRYGSARLTLYEREA